jgi:nuclear transport factor 2 (NTF2) superfamily protein
MESPVIGCKRFASGQSDQLERVLPTDRRDIRFEGERLRRDGFRSPRAGAHFALDARYQEARHEPIVGREAIVAHFTAFFRDGPAWRFHVDDVLTGADRAAVRYRFEIAEADGGWRTRAGCAFATLHDGTLTEWREYEG